MRRTLAVIIVMLVLVAGISLAEMRSGAALGLQGMGGYGSYGGMGGTIVTFKLPELPIVLGAKVRFGGGWSNVGATADWWFINSEISGPFSWYLGVGVYAGVWIGSRFDFAFGGRVPVALEFWLSDVVDLPISLEIFLEAAPGIGAILGSNPGVGFSIPLSVGFRWWF